MSTAIQRGQASIYNGGLPSQSGSGKTMANLQRANQFAKDYKLVTNASKLAGVFGDYKMLNKKTNCAQGDLVGVATKHGYGQKRKRKTKRKTKK